MSHSDPSNEAAELPSPAENAAAASPPVATDPEDDFGDVALGERQAEACSMDEGCTVCQ